MIAALFRSKFGMLLMVLLVGGTFFTLSKLKHRRIAEREAGGATPLAANPSKTGGVEQAASLKRAQENSRGRAEAIRLERAAERQAGSSYDEAGNAFRRRATPEPLPSQLPSPSDRADSGPAPEPLIVPSLRIHGRKSESRETPIPAPSIKNPFDAAIPAITKPFGSTSRSDFKSQEGAKTPVRQPKPERFVPFGRLIKAELVITLESTQEEMPLVALIVEPVYNNGQLVIPAGTELHSSARPDRVRDRIVSATTWRLVFPRDGAKPNGRQLTFEGIALDRDDRDGNGLTWGLTDGSYGIKGRVIKNGQTQEEVLLFATEALRAFGGVMTRRQTTIFGSRTQANARNAAVAGGQAVLEQFAGKISQELKRNGLYIQVAAGKQFYVYPRQVIDPDRADIPENIARVE